MFVGMETEKLYTYFKQCNGVCTDTRKITSNSLFFCLKGENFDGNQFAHQAIENGAKYVNQTVSARVTTMLAFETGNLVFCVLAGEEGKKSKPVRRSKNRGGRVDGSRR